MRRLLLGLLIAVMWVPVQAEEPKIVREIAFIPCEGNPLYLFVFSSGSVAMFDLERVANDEEAQNVFLKLLDRAKAETVKAELVLRQNCPEKGLRT